MFTGMTGVTIAQAGVQGANEFANTATRSQNALMDAFTRAYDSVVNFAPNAVAALVVLVVGFIVSRLVSQAITAVCNKLGLQGTADRGGLTSSLRQMGINRTVPQIMGAIGFWLLMWVFLMATCNIVGLQASTTAFDEVLNYVPKLFVATIVVVLGFLVAAFLKGVVGASADRMGLNYSQHLGNAVYWVLAILTLHMAATQLGLQLELATFAVKVFLGAAALGMGLSFGLGGKDVMAGILAGYYVRQRLQSGDEVTVAGFEGRIREVGPVATIIETEENGLLHRHSVPNSRMLNEAVR